jgi:predicted transcriptional regulator
MVSPTFWRCSPKNKFHLRLDLILQSKLSFYSFIFKRLEKELRINWPLRKRRRQRTVMFLKNELRVIASVAQNRQIGQRSVARELGISQTSVCRILRENKFHPYHVQLVQELKETDFERRLDFCHFIRTQMQVDNNLKFYSVMKPNFLTMVVLTKTTATTMLRKIHCGYVKHISNELFR